MIRSRLVCLGLLVLAWAVPRAVGADLRRVLLLHSFGRDFAPFNTFSAILRAELLIQSPESVDVFEASLESARFTDTAEEGPLLDYLHALFQGRRLDLVVPIGGPAARFAQRHRSRLFPNTPMLISGTDQRHLQPAALTLNDAVVAVRNDPCRILETLLLVLPQTTNIAVVIGNSPLEQFWLGELRNEVQRFTNRVGFDWLNGLSFPRMLDHCAALPPRSAIFYPLLAVDAEGIPHLEERVLARLHDVANAPLFGIYDIQLGRGIVGGPLIAIEDLSRNTAQVAVRILQGEAPGDLRIPPQEPGIPQFDWRELQRWGISEARLPPGSVLRFRQPTLWELHPWRIVAVTSLCLVQALLIALLVANRVRRRRAEQALRESEERLSLATGAADIGVWVWEVSRNRLWASENWRRMFGFSSDAALCFETFVQRIHPDDRAAVEQSVQHAIQVKSDYAGEHRVLLPDGTERWIATRGRLDPASGPNRARMLGAAVDITERKQMEEAAHSLSGRLITAQETERARLARELHDDITQRLARLAIDVAQCEHGASGSSTAQTAREVREGLVRLSEDVHALSYRLHPAVLEDLGLVEALRTECDRFSRRESIPADLQAQDIPELLSHEVSLCLFRVAQEALRNVARHAMAHAVQIVLHGVDGGLQLMVRDDGCGFERASARRRPSLGLASMHERIHLLGGELDIDSAPGQGTTIVAWVPATTHHD